MTHFSRDSQFAAFPSEKRPKNPSPSPIENGRISRRVRKYKRVWKSLLFQTETSTPARWQISAEWTPLSTENHYRPNNTIRWASTVSSFSYIVIADAPAYDFALFLVPQRRIRGNCIPWVGRRHCELHLSETGYRDFLDGVDATALRGLIVGTLGALHKYRVSFHIAFVVKVLSFISR